MRSKSTATILAFFLGVFGGHRFYLGQIGLGLLYFFTMGGFLIGAIIDFIHLLSMSDMEFDYKYNRRSYPEPAPIVINKNTKVADELKKLHELKESGIISDDEFEIQKAKLLA